MEPEQRGERNFSDDVLKIEISGTDRSHFSILDVPGVFQSLTKDLTDQEKDGVRAMVTSYIASKQSIIMYVFIATLERLQLNSAVAWQVVQMIWQIRPSLTWSRSGTSMGKEQLGLSPNVI